jgi:oligosaccharide repeat unit polymerase
MWTLVFTAYAFSPIEINAVHTSTCLLLIFGALAFSFGCSLGPFAFSFGSSAAKMIPVKFRISEVDSISQRITNYILFIYCLGILPFFYRDVMSIGSGLTSLTDIRNLIVAAATKGEKVYSSIITGSIIAVTINSTFISFIEHTKGRYFIYLSVLLTLIYCVLNTGRTALMTLIFGLIAIHLIKRKKSMQFKQAIMSLGLPAILIISSMMGYMFLTHNTVEGDLMTVALDYFFLYVIGGIPALDTIIESGNNIAPHHTFQFFTELSNNLLGTHFEIPPAIDIFVNVPFPTNVYTVYKFFYQDFGFGGTLAAVSIIGFIHGIIYKSAKLGSKYGVYFYAISIYPLLMSFFDDTYYNFRAHIRDIFFIVFSYFVLPRLIRGLYKASIKHPSKEYVGVAE